MYGKHYYYFDKDYDQRLVGSMNMNNWDILRTDVDDESFKIEDTQELYEENCRKTISYINSANMIIKILNKRNINRIISFGC